MSTRCHQNPYPTIPFKGGPFEGQRRPIIDGIPRFIARLTEKGGLIQVYERMADPQGADVFVYRGERSIMAAKFPCEV